MTAEQLTALGTVIAAIAAISAAMIAGNQLKNLADSFRMSGLSAVLAMESEISTRADALDQFDFQLRLGLKTGSVPDDQIEFYEERRATLADSYLNSIDRLAFCILKGYLPEKDWRGEYEVLLNTLLTGPGFPAARNFDNIVKLHNKWQRPPEDEFGASTGE